MNVTASWNIWGIKFNSRTGHQIQMLGSIGFRAFFVLRDSLDEEKGHGAPCPFLVWERIVQEQNALSGCTKSIVQERNDSTTVAP